MEAKMNRVIKFRGKSKWGWHYGNLYIPRRNDCVSVQGHYVDPCTVGQYWLTKNGQDIYEGDIIRVNTCYKLVGWDERCGVFGLKNISDMKYGIPVEWQHPHALWWADQQLTIEVVDNIHDNPYFLEDYGNI